MPDTPSSPGAATGRFPSQVRFIIGNEACERYSFYGMKGILAGYITGQVIRGGLGQSADHATEVIHLFILANYFTPLLGAWVSDRIWGRYRTILWISLLYCLGHGVLALSDVFFPLAAMPGPVEAMDEAARAAFAVDNAGVVRGRMWMLFAGLSLIAFGAGGIKPCVSAFMGDQFLRADARLYERAYAAFYFSINFGSFFSFLTIPFLAKTVGYGWAFGVPGILMGVATLIFWLGRKRYVMVPPTRATRTAGFLPVLWAALSNRTGGGFWDGARSRYSEEEVRAAASVLPVLSIFALIPPFWAMFDQHSSTWILQAQRMVPFPVTGSYQIGGEEMQSLNPLLVMILVPLVTLVLYPMAGRSVRVTPLRRIGLGMFIAGLSYVVVAAIQSRLDAGSEMSVLWQAVPYAILTLAEVLVSTTGLEFAYTQAASSMKSTIMSFWLLTVAAGNAIVVLITRFAGSGSGADSVTPGRFLFYAGLTFAVGLVFIFFALAYRYRDAVASGPAPSGESGDGTSR